MSKQDFNLDMDVYLSKIKRHKKEKSLLSGMSFWDDKSPVEEDQVLSVAGSAKSVKNMQGIPENRASPLKSYAREMARSQIYAKPAEDILLGNDTEVTDQIIALPEQAEYKQAGQKKGLLSKFSITFGKRKKDMEDENILSEQTISAGEIPPSPPQEVQSGFIKSFLNKLRPEKQVKEPQIQEETLEEVRSTGVIDTEVEEIIKSLLKVNVSILQRFSPTQLQRFKESEDYRSFRDAVEKYKQLHG